jgi:signal transduction histidine kinase
MCSNRKDFFSAPADNAASWNEGATPPMPAAAPSADAPQAAVADQRARRKAVPAIEAQKHAFLRLVSHELRTPLNSILGFSEILSAELYGPLGAPQYKEYAEIIRGSGKKLLKLVNQVLEIGRLEGLELDVRPEAVEPALDDAVASASGDFSRGVRTAVAERGDLPLVLADPWGLRTVLTHLLQNAAMFAPDDGEVRVRSEIQHGHLCIFVEDDGEGVDPADLPRLMRPFEQGQNALVRRVEGAGLGLPICELTCRAMGARLQLTSAPGQGMSARVRLKIA